jgi:hypothetical protein
VIELDPADIELGTLLLAWAADIEAVPFPDFADLLVPTQQQRAHHIASPECWCDPLAAPGRWQHRGPLPHTFEPAAGDDITAAGQPTAIHQ